MQIYKHYPLDLPKRPRVVALGFFDGLHRGHERLLRRLVEVARDRGQESLVLTFAEHPSTYLQDRAVPLISLPEERYERLADLGVDVLYLAPPTAEFLQIEAEDFFRRILLQELSASCLIVGPDYRFGAGAKGTVADLERWCADGSCQLWIVPELTSGGEKISSTRIRQLLEAGEAKAAADLLGHPFTVYGRVQSGRQLGRTLGFPTINVPIRHRQVVPRKGVYLAQVRWQGRAYPALLNLGRKPTVESDGPVLIEAWLHDFDGDLYGQAVQIEFLDFVRDEMKFPNIDALRERVNFDKDNSLEYFKNTEAYYDLAHFGPDRVRLYHSPRFVQSRVDLRLTLPLPFERVTDFILLARYLQRAQARYPSPSQLAAALQNLYATDLSLDYGREGALFYLQWTLEAPFRSPDGEEAVLCEALDVLAGLLLEPLRTADGAWVEEALEQERRALALELAARDEDKTSLAFRRLREELGRGTALAVTASGQPERLAQIGAAELSRAYAELFSQAQWTWQLSGPADTALKTKLMDLAETCSARCRQAEPAEQAAHSFHPTEARALERMVRRRLEPWTAVGDIELRGDWQQDLALIALCSPYFLKDHSGLLPLLFMNTLFNDSHALFFQEIRERQGLCYNLFAQAQQQDALLYVCAEVKRGSTAYLRQALLHLLSSVAAGQLPAAAVQQSKALLREQILSAADQLPILAAQAMKRGLYGRAMTTAERLEELAALRVEDLCHFAAELFPVASLALKAVEPTASESAETVASATAVAGGQEEEATCEN